MDKLIVATLKFEGRDDTNTAEEVIRRLDDGIDDGNDFPGFQVKKDGDTYVLYQDGDTYVLYHVE